MTATRRPLASGRHDGPPSPAGEPGGGTAHRSEEPLGHTGPARPPADLVVPVTAGTRVVVVGPLLLGFDLDPATSRLADLLRNWTGPGVVVLAGDAFDLLGAEPVDLTQLLRAQPSFTQGVKAFLAVPDRRLVVLPGTRDARLGSDPTARIALADTLGAEVALAVELVSAAPPPDVGGRDHSSCIRIEPGRAYDPLAAPRDPYQSADTPLATHLLTEVLADLGPAGRRLLAGADRLLVPGELARLSASRVAYRWIGRVGVWLLVPLLLAFAVKVPLAALLPVVRAPAHQRQLDLVIAAGFGTLVDLVAVVALAGLGLRWAWQTIARPPAGDPNVEARRAASALVTAGATGLVTGHSGVPELTAVGPGFYANCGACATVTVEHRARRGLPSVFLAEARTGWVEIAYDERPEVRLSAGQAGTERPRLLERLATARRAPPDRAPELRATWPDGSDWPGRPTPLPRVRRTRRLAAGLVGLVGLVDLVSGLTPPLRARLVPLAAVLPFSLAIPARAAASLAGIALLGLAGGIRRGQRTAWAIAIAILVASALLRLAHGGDPIGTGLAVLGVVVLVAERRRFGAAVDRPSLTRGIGRLVVGVVVAVGLALGGIEASRLTFAPHRALPLTTTALAVTERLVGIETTPLPQRINEVVTVPLLAIGVGLSLATLVALFRPVGARLSSHHHDLERARAIVAAHGRGTLDYFALRDDKTYLVLGSTLVAFAVISGVCLVSPDPIGPEAERADALAELLAVVDRRGWIFAVLGAGADWLPVYHHAGLHSLYVGDEAIVAVQGFGLDGGRRKALRQAVQRVERHGYRAAFCHPDEITPTDRRHLEAIWQANRRGEAERGFSMTLGRLADPSDPEVLVAIAYDADGVPVAFCQYVPAPGIRGYSLDLMRRDRGPHPNGLIDFLIVATIRYVADRGGAGLGLNFATLRAVLADETADELTQRAERWLLHRLSTSMQIESLWRFNAKYDPIWQPRYLVYDSPEHLGAVGLAIARAESFSDLPVVGRLLARRAGRAGRPSPTEDGPNPDSGTPDSGTQDRGSPSPPPERRP